MCSVEDCSSPVLAKGLCKTHYHRLRETGSLLLAPKVSAKGGCEVTGCGDEHYGNGLCRRHYDMQRRRGTTEAATPQGGAKRCSECDRVTDGLRRGMCQNCYRSSMRKDRGLKKPGPAPQPELPKSRHNKESTQRAKSERPTDSTAVRKARATKQACLRGHAYTDENTYVWQGHRQCRTCRNEQMRARRGVGPGAGAHNAAKTHCPQGHEYTPENTLIGRTPWGKGIRRNCRTCFLAGQRRIRIKRYGITLEQYDQMLIAQSGRCAVCLAPFSADICVDHDHACCPDQLKSCGKCVRALLCHGCNAGLGRFLDSPEILRAAVSYLESFPV